MMAELPTVPIWVHCQKCNKTVFTPVNRVFTNGLRYGYGRTEDNPIILNHLFCDDEKDTP